MTLSFSHPVLLVLLAVPVWILVRVWRRSAGRLVLPFDHSGASRGHLLASAVNVAESLPGVLLAVVIVILAGPQRLGAPKSARELTNIELCVDISSSMGWQLADGVKYDYSMEAIRKFVDYRKGDAFGLTFFGNNVLRWVPLTSDVSAVKCAPPFMHPHRVPNWFGGTEIGKALLACRQVLNQRETGDRMIILVSDGASADLYGDRSMEIAQQLRDSKIVVHAIHVDESTVPDDIVNIAGVTGGEVFGVEDPQMLDHVFQRIDQMQQTRLVQLTPESRDDFASYCVAGLGLLALTVMSMFGLRYTPW